MKAVQIDETGSALKLVELPVPTPAAGEVLLGVEYCGICGSDLHMLKWGIAGGLVMGHEFTGAVTQLGPGVADWSIGDRACVIPMVACGSCEACRSGLANACEKGLSRGPGLGRQGGYAQSVAVPAGMLRSIPDHVSDADGALAEPLAVALRGINHADVTAADRICVLGGGPIGALSVVGLLARGHDNVVLVEPVGSRRAVIDKLGVPTLPADGAAQTVVQTLGGAPTVVLDCSGHQSGMPLALELLGPGGRLSMVGIPDVPVEISVMGLAMKEITVRGSLAYSSEEFEEAIDQIAAGRAFAQEIVTSVIGLEDTVDAFADLTSGSTSQVKVLIRPGG